MKKLLFVLALVLVLMLLPSCNIFGCHHDEWLEIGTYWQSEDKNIWFYVTEEGIAIGEITVNNITYKVYFEGSNDTGHISVISGDFLNKAFIETYDIYEYWHIEYSFFNRKSFTATVFVKAYFFDVDEEIKFYRNDSLKNSFHKNIEKIVDNDNKINITKEYSLSQLKNFFGEHPQNEKIIYFPSIIPTDDWQFECVNTFNAANVFFDIQCIRKVNDMYYSILKVKEGGLYYVFWEPYQQKFVPVYSVYISILHDIQDFECLTPGTNTAADVAAIDTAMEVRFMKYGSVESYTLLKNGNFLKITYEDRKEITSRNDLVIRKIEEINKDEIYSESYLKHIRQNDLYLMGIVE